VLRQRRAEEGPVDPLEHRAVQRRDVRARAEETSCKIHFFSSAVVNSVNSGVSGRSFSRLAAARAMNATFFSEIRISNDNRFPQGYLRGRPSRYTIDMKRS
jgi:hypothetical protein